MHLQSTVNNMWLYEICKLLCHVFIAILHFFCIYLFIFGSQSQSPQNYSFTYPLVWFQPGIGILYCVPESKKPGLPQTNSSTYQVKEVFTFPLDLKRKELERYKQVKVLKARVFAAVALYLSCLNIKKNVRIIIIRMFQS